MIVGHLYRGWGGTYWVVEHDPAVGFWLAELGEPSRRRDISERAIGRTYHHHPDCPCSTGVDFPEGLTADELAQLTVFDAVVFDLARSESQAILPAWLCMSAEARESARERFVEWGRARGLVEAGAEQVRAWLNGLVRHGGAPALSRAVSAWRRVESELKRSRLAGNPGAFFFPSARGQICRRRRSQARSK